MMDEDEDLWQTLLAQVTERREQMLVWLAEHAIKHDLSVQEVGDEIGLSRYGMLQLFDGVRRPDGLSDRHFKGIGDLLGMTVVTVKCAAGLLGIEDFYDAQSARQHAKLARARFPALRQEHRSVALFANLLMNHCPPRASLRERFYRQPAGTALKGTPKRAVH